MRYELLFGVQVYDQPVKHMVTSEENVTIGSGSRAVVQIDDPAVDELHCVISQQEDGKLVLLNYGEARSTLLNGKPAKSEVVKAGDTIWCGGVTVKLLECRERLDPKLSISGSFKAAVGKVSKWAKDKGRSRK